MSRASSALALVLLLMVGCDRQDAAWRDAREQDTIAAYEQYLERFADSPQADEAEQRIRQLREEALWEESQAADTGQAYRRFLEQFPDGEHAAAARSRLEALERADRWQRLRDSSDVDALREFAEQYGDHPLAEQARQRAAELEDAARAREQARLEAERQRRIAEQAARTHRVQLAAFRSAAQARTGAQRLEQRLADVLGDTALEIEPAGNYHLVRTAPMSEDAARELCTRLKARDQDCLVVER